ncbi:MAG: plasmid pRiA4b ORF-3 family protein, partial [Candidatus Krumholzibacteria bacterium]|nr:plasmid pRiA4b ORF-3 family protein [Candidatus Krumholzibacteria bacterium]
MTDNNNSNIIPFPGSGAMSGILQFRVEILLMPLPIWRRFQVPGHYSFWDLHVAIQDVVGWEDKHLHQFTLDDPATAIRVRLGIPDDSGFYGMDEVLPGWEHRVTRFMKPDSLPALYTYDFGDEWQHEIMLEAILP